MLLSDWCWDFQRSAEGLGVPEEGSGEILFLEIIICLNSEFCLNISGIEPPGSILSNDIIFVVKVFILPPRILSETS